MKRFGRLIAVSVFLFAGVFALFAEPVREAGGGKTGELILLHTNDHHGVILPNGGKGGLAEVSAYVKAVNPTACCPQAALWR
ncbi:MAG: hypothetical protein LBD48_07740 [Treponema sp.]|jgi:5'-nucleotidase/UDP-sugar diphosphatase|nr:hypothetical protein [Treponema sp.]